MFPSLVSLAVGVALQLPATGITYEWTSLDGTVRTSWNAGHVTVRVKGSRARAREVAAEVRSEFGALAEPRFVKKDGGFVVTIRR